MSTFKGVVTEFPDIRIDYFRPSTDPRAKPPLACFLSHVHSDHIQGLDGPYNSPFVYCSAATKELLIRLERRVHRLNLQKGIIESHDCRYKEKKALLKTIPLETPTWVELDLNRKIRVTLFDANHCVGAVMFLIESQDGCAILYTGDIRAEDWWVDHLKRHPVLLPYTTGMKRLDKLYLDTSWGWRGYDKFASKREGVQELLNKLFKYPDDTIFHLNTWTFGYEDVWVALAAAFNSKIHLNSYLFRLYMSIKQSEKWIHGPFLGGFELGNNTQDAVITTNPDVRFHSCERGLKCPGLKKKKVVYITPIIARIGGEELNEEGIDFGDLNNSDDFSLYGQVKVLLDVLGPTLPSHVKHMLIDASKSRKQSIPLGSDNKEIPLKDFIEILTKVAQNKAKGGGTFKGDDNWPGTTSIRADNGDLLPTWIKFPYSRHSCLPELRNLVGALRPKDIYPCVLEEVDWNEKNSVENIYGDLCSERIFAHDAEMRKLYDIRVREDKKWEEKVEEMAEESQARLHHG
ncbi:beta-lactamase-like protein, partial [Geopyxis carbonaria]